MKPFVDPKITEILDLRDLAMISVVERHNAIVSLNIENDPIYGDGGAVVLALRDSRPTPVFVNGIRFVRCERMKKEKFFESPPARRNWIGEVYISFERARLRRDIANAMENITLVES